MLLQVKELKGKGYDNKTIGVKVGLSPFIAGKYVTQASKFRAADQCPVPGLLLFPYNNTSIFPVPYGYFPYPFLSFPKNNLMQIL